MMTKVFKFKRGLASLLMSTCLLGGVPLISSFAVAAEEEKKPQKTRRVPSMSESVYKKLAEAQESIDAKDLVTAQSVLQTMLDRSKRYNGNEVGQVHNMMGYVFFLKEDYKGAIRHYKEVVAQGEKVSEGLESQALYTLAQLSFVEEEFNDALRYMETWITKANNPGPEPRHFMATVYYQMKDYKKSIVQMELAIDIARERGTQIKENWWQLLNFLYFEREDWGKVIETLEILVREFPKRDYWVRLAGVHGQEGREKLQLKTLQAAYVAGFLTKETDLTNLAGLLMQEEIPYPAAEVLEKGLDEEIVPRNAKNLRALGQALQLAQEVDRAIPVFEAAAKLADDGKIYERLAYLYLEADKHDSCVRSANGALDKGGVNKRQNVYTVRGMCMYNKNQSSVSQISDARGSFVSCRNESRKDKDKTSERVCAQWITFLDKEKDRLARLAAAS